MTSVLKKLLVLTLAASIFLAAINSPSSRTVAQQSTKSLSLSGLRGRVTVRRDERGIPYIEATNDDDLHFAQGYVTASDRLWQMDLLRRTARGELAEILGAGPNNVVLEQDKQHRTLGFAREAEAEVAQAAPRSRVLLEAYAAGVNAYINSLDAKSLPPEFQI
ncbi:MAG TPA: penicillin acylase family protein, partial [Pyrinomonadaceae bacterium]|nr:penicillin acylase family protein [Pyrinomonadaceae bacterium]